MNAGTITITLEGATFEQTERCREMIHTMFEQGIFHIKNGKALLHFDHEGQLQQIEVDLIKWKRNKPSQALADVYKNATISIIK